MSCGKKAPAIREWREHMRLSFGIFAGALLIGA